MIYLIGGPPKCGKTTLAKYMLKEKGIPWISTDTLQNVIRIYMTQEDISESFPTIAQRCNNNDQKYTKFSADEIISAYKKQSEVVWDAIDMFIISEVTDGNDFVIEGYHITPELVLRLQQKYKDEIKSVFIIKKDEENFIKNIKESSTPNDWIISRTKYEKTYKKIAKMVSKYSTMIERDAQKNGLNVVNMDHDFNEKIINIF